MLLTNAQKSVSWGLQLAPIGSLSMSAARLRHGDVETTPIRKNPHNVLYANIQELNHRVWYLGEPKCDTARKTTP